MHKKGLEGPSGCLWVGGICMFLFLPYAYIDFVIFFIMSINYFCSKKKKIF